MGNIQEKLQAALLELQEFQCLKLLVPVCKISMFGMIKNLNVEWKLLRAEKDTISKKNRCI